jgi:predicted nucleotidyltransferase
MSSLLKEKLLQIQLYLLKNEFSSALALYEEILENWKAYSQDIPKEEVSELLRLVNHLKEILQEKGRVLKKKQAYFKVRKEYARY